MGVEVGVGVRVRVGVGVGSPHAAATMMAAAPRAVTRSDFQCKAKSSFSAANIFMPTSSCQHLHANIFMPTSTASGTFKVAYSYLKASAGVVREACRAGTIVASMEKM